VIPGETDLKLKQYIFYKLERNSIGANFRELQIPQNSSTKPINKKHKGEKQITQTKCLAMKVHHGGGSKNRVVAI
jgi:hypothetical protein